MARGQRRQAEDVLQEIDAKIERHQAAIKTLEDKKAEIIKTKQENEIHSLYDFMQKNNIQIDKAFELLGSK